jgi:D-beta-D-heptose 7-phosphate kinase/D-beta-D-heptose 1-phosphate adenosyltransferase
MSDILFLIEQFPQLRVLVIGEAILDRYLYGSATRLCQETPVPVVSFSHCIDQPGGAANTAVNVQNLGAQVTLLSVIGRDWEGTRLQQALLDQNVESQDLVIASDRTTLTKQRVLDGDRMLLRFDQGTTNSLSVDLENQLIQSIKTSWCESDAIIISDYGYGILTPRIINAIAQFQSQSSKILVVDAKDLNRYQRLKATAVKPNYQQTLQLLNEPKLLDSKKVSRVNYIEANAMTILNRTGAMIAAVTLDQDGAILLQRHRSPHRIYANPACPTRTIDAGDTFTAALTIALATGASPTIAADLAAAAAIVVNKSGTAICTIEELKTNFLSVVSHP